MGDDLEYTAGSVQPWLDGPSVAGLGDVTLSGFLQLTGPAQDSL
jgi:hypothetical protein